MNKLRLAIGLALLSVAAFGQESPVSRLGIGVVQNTSAPVSGTNARDELVRLINAQRPMAVALEALLPDEKMGLEARQKNCKMVLVASLVDLSGPTVQPSVCVNIGIPDPRGGSAPPVMTQLAAAVLSELNQPSSGLAARVAAKGCAYEVNAGAPWDTTSTTNLFNKRVAFRVLKAGETRPLLEGEAIALLAHQGDPATPEMVAGLAQQIAVQTRSKILKTQSKLSSGGVPAVGVAYNLIDTGTVSSVAKGSAKATDPGGSLEKALDSALQQVAAAVMKELQNKVAKE